MPPAYKMKDNAVRALLFLPYPCHQAHLFFFFFLNINGEQFLPDILLRKTSRAWNRSEFSKPESIASIWTEHVPGHRFGPLAKAPQSLRPKPPAQTTASELRFPIPWQNTNFRGKKIRAGVKSPSSTLHDGAKPESLQRNYRLQQQQKKTQHNTPAKALNKQTNKAPKTKLRNKRQTKKGVEELLRGCPSAIAVNRAAKVVTRNRQCACVLGKVSSSLSSVCTYGDRLGFQTEP
jgi:hypothetical protein